MLLKYVKESLINGEQSILFIHGCQLSSDCFFTFSSIPEKTFYRCFFKLVLTFTSKRERSGMTSTFTQKEDKFVDVAVIETSHGVCGSPRGLGTG